MRVLHVASVRDLPQSGVAAVVPQYVEHQAVLSETALLNLSDFVPKNHTKYKLFHYSRTSQIQDLPEGFNTPDLVIFHEVYWPKYIKLARYCRSKEIPYIIVPHVSLTDTAQKNKQIKKVIGNLLLFNGFIKNAISIQFLSESEKQQSSKYNNLPNFIRSNGISTRGLLKKQFNKDRLSLIYIGRLDYKIKGIDRLLAVINVIQSEMRKKGISVTLYGSSVGNNLERIERDVSNYGVGDLVKVGGGLFGEDKIKEILRHDCFIQLSRTEGQPLAIMEAMDIGMPCIVTEGTTFREVTSKFGVGIPVGDSIEEIADTIFAIRAGEYNLKSISKKASVYTRENFDWRKVGRYMIEDYEFLLRGRE